LKEIGHVPIRECPEAITALIFNHINKAKAAQPRKEKNPSQGSVRCSGQQGVTYEGTYDRIEISECSDVIVKNSSAQKIRILDSTVQIENSEFYSKEETLYALRSRVILTGGRIEGETAVVSSESKLDIAGTALVGKKEALKSISEQTAQAGDPGASTILFSLCPVQSPYSSGFIHGTRVVSPDKPL
ncbi:MAG: hypothetical protein AB1659_12605, partial [Thermodesulfobacteriota bacterium]